MSGAALETWGVAAAVWVVAARPLGRYVVRVVNREPTMLDPWLTGVEHWCVGRRAAEPAPSRSLGWYGLGAMAVALACGWSARVLGTAAGPSPVVGAVFAVAALLGGMAAQLAVVLAGLRALGGHAPGRLALDWIRLLTRVALPFVLVLGIALAAAGVANSVRVPQALLDAARLVSGHSVSAAGLAFSGSANVMAVAAMGLLPLAVFRAAGPLTGSVALGRALPLVLVAWFGLVGIGVEWTSGISLAGVPTAWGLSGTALHTAAGATLGLGAGPVLTGLWPEMLATAGQLAQVAGGPVGSGLLPLMGLAVLTAVVVNLMRGRSPVFLGRRVGLGAIVAGAALYGMRPVLVLGTLGVMAAVGPRSGSLAMRVASVAASLGSPHLGAMPWAGTLGVLSLVGTYTPWVIWLRWAGTGLRPEPRLRFEEGLVGARGWLVALLIASMVMTALLFLPVLALGPVVGANS